MMRVEKERIIAAYAGTEKVIITIEKPGRNV